MTWEYLLLEHNGRYWSLNGDSEKNLTGRPNHEVLNLMGREGWELVDFSDRDRIELCFYLKRPLQ